MDFGIQNAIKVTGEGIPPGFMSDGMRIRFIEPKGKDASFNRWRAAVYYMPNYAETKFFYTELEYEIFLASKMPKCFATYAEFVRAYELSL